MAKKEVIEINEEQLKEIVKESVTRVMEFINNDSISVEDYFDISSLTKSDVQHMATDIRVFLQGQGYGSDLSDEGELILKEGSNVVMPIKALRKELQKLGFKQWQIKSEIAYNKVRVVVLYADLAKNTSIIENKMLSCGWTKAHISDPVLLYGIPVRVMDFDPKEQKPITKQARRYKFLYHWTPYNNLQSVFQTGIEPRNENDFLSYPPKAHLMKGDTPKSEASKLGWMLFNKNNSLMNGRYALLRISMKIVPNDIEFYGDSRFQYGYFTNVVIPPQALELFGEITYSDKYNYNNEQIKVLVNDDTMVNQ